MSLSVDVDPTEDFPHEPQPVPHWSESYAFWAWDHKNDLTVYAHFQRHPDKPVIWRGYAVVMKGDQVYALHSYGRQRSPFGPGFESCHMLCEEPHALWRLRAEGAGQHRTTHQLSQAAITDGPAVPFKVDIQLSLRSPVWSISHGSAIGAEEIMPAHYEQTGRIVGIVEIGDTTYKLDCLGANDHSYGPRNTQKLVNGSGFINCVFPSGRSLTGIQMSPESKLGYIHNGDNKIRQVSEVTLPQSGWGPGETGKLIVVADGVTAKINYEVTRRHVVLTMIPPNYEHIGLVHGPATKLGYYDISCKLEWDGEEGAGSWEPCFSRD